MNAVSNLPCKVLSSHEEFPSVTGIFNPLQHKTRHSGYSRTVENYEASVLRSLCKRSCLVVKLVHAPPVLMHRNSRLWLAPSFLASLTNLTVLNTFLSGGFSEEVLQRNLRKQSALLRGLLVRSIRERSRCLGSISPRFPATLSPPGSRPSPRANRSRLFVGEGYFDIILVVVEA